MFAFQGSGPMNAFTVYGQANFDNATADLPEGYKALMDEAVP